MISPTRRSNNSRASSSAPPTKKKRAVRITKKEALNRIDDMTQRLEDDVKAALWIEAAMEAANAFVVSDKDRHYHGAETYNAVAQSMMLTFAITVARLFDQGVKNRHPNKRDVSSLPLFVRLLRQKRCRNALIERARHWSPAQLGRGAINARDCENAIDRAIGAYHSLSTTGHGRHAVARLKQFRDYRVAHTLMKAPARKHPTYNSLFLLVDTARNVMQAAILAVKGHDPMLEYFEQDHSKEAKKFWETALKGATITD
ncbi:hypothetical protein [Phyllobacterium bourgognense]|uniref:HEPN AbiU2-like domain-containing protein n=1 Tax=Phyllobacterium bourgognense TaxID=314236 RepID=A0A368YZ20_9HYPH|nr:hypothetical protein [Phyllobacterium bourgognense]RCW85450.1 hypothetical protein C7476_103293 [Phyllobacterium bourgognense]